MKRPVAKTLGLSIKQLGNNMIYMLAMKFLFSATSFTHHSAHTWSINILIPTMLSCSHVNISPIDMMTDRPNGFVCFLRWIFYLSVILWGFGLFLVLSIRRAPGTFTVNIAGSLCRASNYPNQTWYWTCLADLEWYVIQGFREYEVNMKQGLDTLVEWVLVMAMVKH